MRGDYRLDGGKHHAYFITLKNYAVNSLIKVLGVMPV